MSQLSISAENVEVEAPDLSAVHLMVGLMATLEIRAGGQRWVDEGFPVLELAMVLRRSKLPNRPLEFQSMNMEPDPVLTFNPQGDEWQITTFDGHEFRATADELEAAIGGFLDSMDEALSSLAGTSLERVHAALWKR